MVRVNIESPYKASRPYTVLDNEAFARRACLHAVRQGYNPYAMHLFFTQFLDDVCPDDRALGIRCGIEWARLAQETWINVRAHEALTSGMIQGLQAVADTEPDRPIRFLRWDALGVVVQEDIYTLAPTLLNATT